MYRTSRVGFLTYQFTAPARKTVGEYTPPYTLYLKPSTHSRTVFIPRSRKRWVSTPTLHAGSNPLMCNGENERSSVDFDGGTGRGMVGGGAVASGVMKYAAWEPGVPNSDHRGQLPGNATPMAPRNVMPAAPGGITPVALDSLLNAAATAHLLAPCSVLVITFNEEINIAGCLQRLAFSDDIVVLDSFSTDRTLEIAKTFANVRVVQRKYDTQSLHTNWAFEHIQFKYPWLYCSDADEHMTSELAAAIGRVARDMNPAHVAYRVRYQNMFMGQWIRHGGIYPVWIMRLVRPDKVRFEARETNAHPVANGSVGYLRGHFIHYSFSKGLYPWLKKHNLYSQQEAREAVRVQQGSLFKELGGAFKGDRSARRRSLKNVSFYLPARDFVRFVYMYVLRAGYLDGKSGLHYAAMISMYEYWIALKAIEARQGNLGPGVCEPGQDVHMRISTGIEWARQRAAALQAAGRRQRRSQPRLGGRPMWAFLREYVLHGGVLRGRAGWRSAKLAAGDEYMLRLLLNEGAESHPINVSCNIE